MQVRIKKWGNSLALRIPKPFAEETAVGEGAIVDLSVEGGRLVATPTVRGKYTLKQLLRRISSRNLHTEGDWGRPKGREVW